MDQTWIADALPALPCAARSKDMRSINTLRVVELSAATPARRSDASSRSARERFPAAGARPMVTRSWSTAVAASCDLARTYLREGRDVSD